MKEWFKARTIWGAAVMALSDAEAGRLMKAIWEYEMTGNQQNLSGAEKGIFALILMTLGQDDERESQISAKRAEAGAKGGKQRQAKEANAIFATEEIANVANASNKNKNKEKDIKKETLLTECKEKKFVAPTVEEVEAYCRERGNTVSAQQFVDFYTAKGWKIGNNSMKDWKACVRTWEKNRIENRPKVVHAQQFSQRDYSGEQDAAMQRMIAQMGGTA